MYTCSISQKTKEIVQLRSKSSKTWRQNHKKNNERLKKPIHVKQNAYVTARHKKVKDTFKVLMQMTSNHGYPTRNVSTVEQFT